MDVFVCGICGGSGAGRTTLTKRLVERLGEQGASVLAFDAYYRDLSHLLFAERRRRNFDHPDSLDSALFLKHLDALRQGIDVDVPVYDFSTHTLSGRFERVAAAPLLLVEGILLLAFEEVAERQEVRLPLVRPFEDQPDLAGRQTSPHHAPVSNGDLDFLPGVLGVEVRRGMIPDVHPDDDAEELAELRHPRRRSGPA